MMRPLHRFWGFLFLGFLISYLQFTQPLYVEAIPVQQQTVFNSTLVYYRDNQDDDCGDNPAIQLGDFIKHTLPFEWTDSWANVTGGDEALKAGAIAIRSWALSASNSEIYAVNGQNYFCIKAWFPRLNFQPTANISPYIHSNTAVDDTDGIIMSHSVAPTIFGVKAIDAQFRTESGSVTLEYPSGPGDNKPWLKSIFDPISVGNLASDENYGLGVLGSKRWAWGLDEQSNPYPRWDFRRILAHYYTEVEFVGISPIPPNDRTNIAQIQGIPLDGGLTMCQGEADRTGYFSALPKCGPK